MARYDSRLITPPPEEEEIYPYRRVWVSILIEAGVLFGFVMLLFVLTRFVVIPPRFYQALNIAIALLPLGLWLIFSWWRERFVPQPRRGLLGVAVVSGLAANAISLPFIEQVFQIERWLPLESALNRIIGYTFTVGLVQTLTVYLVLRYSVWPQQFRVRIDGVAYGAASAIGYVTVLNLQFVMTTPSMPFITVTTVFHQVAVLMCCGIVVGYGLAEMAFNRYLFPLLLTATIAVSAFIAGAAIPLTAGFTNAGVSALNPVGSISPILGFLFSAGLLFLVGNIFSFLFNVAERQDSSTSVEDAEGLAS